MRGEAHRFYKYMSLAVVLLLLIFGSTAYSKSSKKSTTHRFSTTQDRNTMPQRKKTSTKEIFPVHPRVNINWTQGMLNANVSEKKRRAIENSKLVLTKLLVINRHGHRAPNAPYWTMCSADIANKKHYNVDPEDLSAMGMKEELDFGKYIRFKYRDFLGDRFNRSLHFFRAVGEPRILQSAMAVAQGIFPDGFGPAGFLPSRPQYIPIFSDMDTHEYLLDDVPCFRRAERDSRNWIKNYYNSFMNDRYNKKVVQKMQEICGTSNSSTVDYAYIKTVSDGMIFNSDFGLSVAGGTLTAEWLMRMRNVSLNLLMQRLYHTDEQQTYMAVDLPRSILQLFNHTHIATGQEANDFRDTRQEATFYFLHREALYALAQFFGFQYHVPNLPHGELPVASSLIFEKLLPLQNEYSHDESQVYVRITLWTPYAGSSTVPIMACHIPELCKLRELRNIFEQRIARTGTWEKLCNYMPQEIDHTTDIR